nr:hypothetical transcript [Hymenolepis microstoma]
MLVEFQVNSSICLCCGVMASTQKYNVDQQKNRISKMKKDYLRIECNKRRNQVLNKKQRFQKLLERQKEIEQGKVEKRKLIESKRQERDMKRKQRNKAWCKLNKKGQPILKERINYLLKELEIHLTLMSSHASMLKGLV